MMPGDVILLPATVQKSIVGKFDDASGEDDMKYMRSIELYRVFNFHQSIVLHSTLFWFIYPDEWVKDDNHFLSILFYLIVPGHNHHRSQ